jgi:hypothetical protein
MTNSCFRVSVIVHASQPLGKRTVVLDNPTFLLMPERDISQDSAIPPARVATAPVEICQARGRSLGPLK